MPKRRIQAPDSFEKIRAFLVTNDAALKESGPLPERIHQTRLQGKRIRAALQLLKPFISTQEFGKLTRRVKTAGELLAKEREEHVLRKETQRVAKEIGGAKQRRLEQWLQTHLPTHRPSALPKSLQRATDLLSRSLADWPSRKKSLSVLNLLDAGTEKTFRHARKAFCDAKKSHCPEDFHEWRTWTKRLCLQLEIARGLKIDIDPSLLKRLDKLQSKLGEAHDLDAAEKFICASNEGRDKLLEQALTEFSSQRDSLEKKVLKRGRKIFLKKTKLVKN